MATMATAQRLWTYADLEDIPDDGNRYDILGGMLVMRNVPSPEHGEALTELLIFFGWATEAGYGRMYTSSTAVALDYARHGEDSVDVPHPDIFFMRQDRLDLKGKRGWEGVPDLIVEILSPGTRQEHRAGGRWWDAYDRNGVPHYWQVDLVRRQILQYPLIGDPHVGGHYDEPVTLREGDNLGSPLFPTITMPVSRVFRYVRGEGS